MSQWTANEILVERDGPVATLTLNRPDRQNAVNEALHDALGDVWRHLLLDESVKAVVLTGAGKSFSAGGDMEYLERVATEPDYRYRTMAAARRIVSEMMAFHKPVVAAVNGPAVGLGCSLAVMCDIVVMADTAFFSDPHVTLGVVAADGGVLAWPLMMSVLRAKEYLFTGDRIDALAAERLGLANRVVARDETLAEAQKLAARLASQPTQALWDTKRAINMHMARAVSSVVDFAFAAESETFAHPGFRATLDSYKQAAIGSPNRRDTSA